MTDKQMETLLIIFKQKGSCSEVIDVPCDGNVCPLHTYCSSNVSHVTIEEANSIIYKAAISSLVQEGILTEADIFEELL